MRRRGYTLLWAAFGLFSVLFAYTDGWAYVCNDTAPDICHINVPMGPNVDDDFDLEIGAAFAAVAVVWGIFRYRRPLGPSDFVVYALLLLMQALLLTDIQYGSIAVTVTRDYNAVLFMWVLCYGMLCIGTVGHAVAALRRRLRPRQ